MWGQDRLFTDLGDSLRIIPTRVGTRQVSPFRQSAKQDHPHACGDKYTAGLDKKFTEGSSPRVWGQEPTLARSPSRSRIIPTRVGTRRGDIMSDIVNTGSSPRVWGQGKFASQSSFFVRIIPTRVGTRMRLNDRKRNFQDHPHACGDKVFCRRLLLGLLGSSPRVWGQVNTNTGIAIIIRIIPTRVGTSFKRFWRCNCCRDHPHACGDKHDRAYRR